MKFCKRYQEYMRNQEKKLPGVEFKKLKKILKRCRKKVSVQKEEGFLRDSRCPSKCPVCDGTFFPSLLDEMSAVVSCFNERAHKLMKFHLASSFQKFFIQFKSKLQGNHIALVKEGHDLVTYAIINSIAIRKILKKYDKVHYSKQGQAFRSEAQKLHVEILQSPWLCELMAFHMNLSESKTEMRLISGLFESCSLNFDSSKPTLSCSLFDSVKLNFDLTCSICLDTVFDPVALACGHIFCYMCACSAASVTIVDGLKSADGKSKCPLCREEGVYGSAVHLEELNNLLSQSCRDYWEQRTKSERQERIRQVKEHWESQCRAFVGV